MAAPTSGQLDNFTRSNVGPPLGGNWSPGVIQTTGGLQIASNRCVWGAAGGFRQGQVWNLQTFGPDTEAWVTVGSIAGTVDNDEMDLYVRVTNPGASVTCYSLIISLFTGTWAWTLFSTVAGSGSSIGTINQQIAAGDRMALQVLGTQIIAWYQPVNGAWTALMTVTDSSVTGSGNIGLEITNDQNIKLSEFGGGTVAYLLESPRDFAASRFGPF